VLPNLESLALVAQRTVNSVIITDAQRRIVWANPGFERITGYSCSEVVGRSPGELLQFEGTEPQTAARLRDALNAGRNFAGEILNRGQGGNEYWSELDIQPLHDAAGAIAGFMPVQTAITARLEAEAEARRNALRLRQAIDAQTRFLAIVSHELRTPLKIIACARPGCCGTAGCRHH
jgi:PAS domain S-box-containing protein